MEGYALLEKTLKTAGAMLGACVVFVGVLALVALLGVPRLAGVAGPAGEPGAPLDESARPGAIPNGAVTARPSLEAPTPATKGRTARALPDVPRQ